MAKTKSGKKEEKENFLFREISPEEKEEIKDQAKKLLEEFSSKLEKIKSREKISSGETREEGKGWETGREFRDIIFCNAPNIEDGFIIGEKGGWK